MARPLIHPGIKDISVEGILHALADPVRVAIFAEIVNSDSAHSCTQLSSMNEKDIPKSTLSQHFKALREAGLIRSERQGVEMKNMSRCSEVDKRFPGLIAAIVDAHKREKKGK